MIVKAEASMPIHDVITLITDTWDMEEIDAEAAANLFRKVAVRLLDRLQQHPDTASITLKGIVPEPPTPGSDDDPFGQGDAVWTRGPKGLRRWYVDQSGAFFETADEAVPPVQAWHGDDTELRADDAKPARRTLIAGLLTESERAQNQWAATQALASGRISVEEVGAVVKGLHDASVYRVEVPRPSNAPPSLQPGHDIQRGSNEKTWWIKCQCGFEVSGPRDFENTGDQQAEAIRDHRAAVRGE